MSTIVVTARVGRACVTLFAVACFALCAGVARGEPGEDPGQLSADQSEIAGDDTEYETAAPVPMSGSGAVAPGSYSTVLWPEEATGIADGIQVVHSTAANTFALTGGVIDDATGAPVAGAKATIWGLTNARPCTAKVGCLERMPADCEVNCPYSRSTSTDAKGTFAFIDMPNTYGGYLHLRVTAAGYGTYTLRNVSALDLDREHVAIVELNANVQEYDQAAPPHPAATFSAVARLVSAPAVAPLRARRAVEAAAFPSYPPIRGYASETRPPPVISVWMYPIGKDVRCPVQQLNKDGSPAGRVVVMPWRRYVLATMAGEIGGNAWKAMGNGQPTFGPVASTAAGETAHSFAWYFRKNSNVAPEPGADISNWFGEHQCTNPNLALDSDWNALLTSRIHTHRIATPGDPGTVIRASFANGSYNCPEDPRTPAGGDQYSQLGGKAWEEKCGKSSFATNGDWIFVVNRFYSSASVRESEKPKAPRTGFQRIPNGVWFEFHSLIGGYNVGWMYMLERSKSGDAGSWRQFKAVGFSSRLRDIRQDYKHFPDDDTCWYYRVRGWNPVGKSDAATFNNGNCIERG
jgi:hypothetical protein